MVGKSIVTSRAIVDIVRTAVQSSYGVTGFSDPTVGRRVMRLAGFNRPGIRVSTSGGLHLDLFITVAFGVPVAEVARQVDSAVRYGLERAIGRPAGPISIHVEGLAGRPFMSAPPNRPERGGTLSGGESAPGGDASPAEDAGRDPAAADGVA